MQQCYFSSVYCIRHSFFAGAALEPCELKINQFSPPILKFSTKLKDNPFNLNCSMVPCTFCLYFMQARIDWVLISFGTQIIKKKRPVRPVFPDYLPVSYDYDPTLYIVASLGFAVSSWELANQNLCKT